MIKGVAFDFDCTLYRRESVWDRLVEGFVDRFESYIDPRLTKADVLAILRQGDSEGIANDDTWQGIFGGTSKRVSLPESCPMRTSMRLLKRSFPPPSCCMPMRWTAWARPWTGCPGRRTDTPPDGRLSVKERFL